MSDPFRNIVVKDQDVFANFLNLVDPFMQSLREPPITEIPEQVQDPNTQKRLNRLAKNRESARNTRMKKKQHLQFLEKRLADLIQEVEVLRTQTSSTNVLVDASIRENFISNKQHLYHQLEALLQNGGSEAQISSVLQVLRNKLGASGVQRQGYIQFLMHQVQELSMPSYLKRIIENSDQQRFPTQLREVAKNYKRSMNQLKKIRKCLLRRTAGLQDLIDYCQTLLAPRQIASILVRLNRSDHSLSPWELIQMTTQSLDKTGWLPKIRVNFDILKPIKLGSEKFIRRNLREEGLKKINVQKSGRLERIYMGSFEWNLRKKKGLNQKTPGPRLKFRKNKEKKFQYKRVLRSKSRIYLRK